VLHNFYLETTKKIFFKTTLGKKKMER